MNVLEENRDTYLRLRRSPRRVMLIVLGVIAAHVVVISAAASWKGWMPKVGEGLIRVSIVHK
jgi:CHASE2 domain-containing sensor protein